MMKKKTLNAILAITLAGGAQTALAASSATATIDWNSFTVSYVDLSAGANAPTLSWDSQYGYSNADVNSNSVYDFSTPLSTSSLVGSTQTISTRTSSVLQATSASESGGDTSGEATSSAEFHLTGNGLAVISMNWSVSVTGTQSDWNNYAYAGIDIEGAFTYADSATSGSVYSTYDINSADSGTGSHSGTFKWVIFVDGSTLGAISAAAQTQATSQSSIVAPVPAPAAVWLFGSGLMLALGLARGKKSIA